jgi:hypothetical protein
MASTRKANPSQGPQKKQPKSVGSHSTETQRMAAEVFKMRRGRTPYVPTREEMLAAGIPESLHPAVPMYNSLEEAAEALAP